MTSRSFDDSTFPLALSVEVDVGTVSCLVLIWVNIENLRFSSKIEVQGKSHFASNPNARAETEGSNERRLITYLYDVSYQVGQLLVVLDFVRVVLDRLSHLRPFMVESHGFTPHNL